MLRRHRYFLRTIYCRQKEILSTTVIALLLPIVPLPAHSIEDSVDNCSNDPNKTEPGECGCGLPEGDCAIADADEDGVGDSVDSCPNTANANICQKKVKSF